ncbi:MAG: DUF3293 domain-containing protein [Betaproteobacteria bacterium]|nr:MAG: DUF3293 domain-containing protein [Betaproteobacteria bacterium]
MTADKGLRQAYLDTVYRVEAKPHPIDIRIGESNAALDKLLQANKVQQWAFVTASNPRSQALSEEKNARRNAEMKSSLQQAGWRTADGVGLPSRPGWQPEHSVLILGIDRHAAIALARRWEQNAIVYGSVGQMPELLWVD